MNLTWILDLVLILTLLSSLMYGYLNGLVLTVLSTVGLLVGGVVAVLAVPIVAAWVPDKTVRGPATLTAAILIVIALFSLGGSIGRALRRPMQRGPLRYIDRLLGAIVNTAVVAVVASLVATSLSSMGAPFLAQPVASSVILSTIDRLTPNPVKAVAAQLRSIVLNDGLPRIVDAFGEQPPAVPQLETGTAPLDAATASVVRITGNAYACGQNQSGTGFVISKNRILTNAHVIAGVSEPVIETAHDGTRVGRIVYFDPQNDFAVIAVDALPTAALVFTSDLTPGTNAVVDGYPFGGPFSSHPAQVVNSGAISVPDIYGENPQPRDVYTVAANVQQGESGGPLLAENGTVAGVIFAKGTSSPNIGYAMTRAQATAVLAAAPGRSAPVTPGRCVKG